VQSEARSRQYVVICDWCRRRQVGLGRPPEMRWITRSDDSHQAWRICLDCNHKFIRLISRLGRGQSPGAIR